MRPIGSDCLPHLRCAPETIQSFSPISWFKTRRMRVLRNVQHAPVSPTRVIKYRKSPPKLANLHLKIPTVFPFMA